MRQSDRSARICAAMQELYIASNLEVEDGLCCAADFFVWALMAPFVEKKDCLEQMQSMFPSMLQIVEDNWEGLQARRKVLEALDQGESGGHLQ